MSDANVSALMLTAAWLVCAVGMACLALAMEVHWAQVRSGHALSRSGAWRLRACGAAGLVVSLMLCLAADHPSMAVLVWVMTLGASALMVAFTLSWRPRWLTPLAVVAG